MTRTHAYVHAGLATLELGALFHFMYANDPAHAILAFGAAGLHALLCSGKRRRARRLGNRTWRNRSQLWEKSPSPPALRGEKKA